MKLSEHAVSNGYNNDPEFCCWVSKLLKRPSRILEKVKDRCRKQHELKLGVHILIDVAESKNLDNDSANTFRHDSIKKVMKNYQVSFQLIVCEYMSIVGYMEITWRFIFDVKI